MPSRNILRQDVDDGYYHVYGRGASRESVFLDVADKDYFLYLLARHLSRAKVISKQGYSYPHYRGKVELLAYCLMSNHYHLLFYQVETGAVSALMKSVTVAYVAYFNRKYKRTGSLFENRFKASLIDRDAYLVHISRYIHLNPRSWKAFPHSSLQSIYQGNEPEWLQSDRLLRLYSSRQDYFDFVADYDEHKQMLDAVKAEMAES